MRERNLCFSPSLFLLLNSSNFVKLFKKTVEKVIKLKNLFEKGVGFRTFILNQSHENRAKFMKQYIPLEIRAVYKERLSKQQHKVYILGVIEGESSDSQQLLAVIEKLISTSQNIELRLISAADTRALEKTPVFVFMNEDFSKEHYFTKNCKEAANEELIEELLNIIEETT